MSHTSLLALRLSGIGTRGALRGTRVTLGHTVFSLTSFLGLSGGAIVRLSVPKHPAKGVVPMSSTLVQTGRGGPAFLRRQRGILRTRRGISGAGGRSHFGTDFGTDINFGRITSGLKSTCERPLRRSLISIDISVPLVS